MDKASYLDFVVEVIRRSDQRAGQHAIKAFYAILTVETDLGQMSQAVCVVGVGLVGGHIERGLGVARVDADRAQTLWP